MNDKLFWLLLASMGFIALVAPSIKKSKKSESHMVSVRGERRGKVKVRGVEVTVVEDPFACRVGGGLTYYDEKGVWTRIVKLCPYLSQEEKLRVLAHEIAEGLSGIGWRLPSHERHKLIQSLESQILEELKAEKALKFDEEIIALRKR